MSHALEYRETAAANAGTYCALCGAEINPDGLAKETAHMQTDALRELAEKAVNFLARFQFDDPDACAVTLHMLHRPGDSCRDIARHINRPKTAVNEAVRRAEAYLPELGGLLGRRKAVSIAQQTRRAAEAAQNEPEQKSLNL